ncbi:hypothetical protein GBAR_LOCUS7278 [Geodia barretti]|uniref:Secreted protein n=1 Tax=Geodia barretti TaxID=519541 RepID=A0AA35WE54_GEOBA|nr:hypothetical protein GBAR_LOCUS7278 [Geodia barretti]
MASSWMVESMHTGLLSIHLSAIMVSSIRADVVSPLASVACCGESTAVDTDSPTRSKSQITSSSTTAWV